MPDVGLSQLQLSISNLCGLRHRLLLAKVEKYYSISNPANIQNLISIQLTNQIYDLFQLSSYTLVRCFVNEIQYSLAMQALDKNFLSLYSYKEQTYHLAEGWKLFA